MLAPAQMVFGRVGGPPAGFGIALGGRALPGPTTEAAHPFNSADDRDHAARARARRVERFEPRLHRGVADRRRLQIRNALPHQSLHARRQARGQLREMSQRPVLARVEELHEVDHAPGLLQAPQHAPDPQAVDAVIPPAQLLLTDIEDTVHGSRPRARRTTDSVDVGVGPGIAVQGSLCPKRPPPFWLRFKKETIPFLFPIQIRRPANSNLRHGRPPQDQSPCPSPPAAHASFGLGGA